MDENEKMDPAIIKGLFEQGVSLPDAIRRLGSIGENHTNRERSARAA